MGALTLVRQPILEKENSEFKLVKLLCHILFMVEEMDTYSS